MNGRERDKLAIVSTDVKWIKEKLDKLPCDTHVKIMTENRTNIKDLKDSRRRELMIFGGVISVVIFLINLFVGRG